jgi:hypothetical protein
MSLYCPDADQTAAACARAKGWPAGPRFISGEGTPEGAETGYTVGDQYTATDTSKQYVFNGTPGENTGWFILN